MDLNFPTLRGKEDLAWFNYLLTNFAYLYKLIANDVGHHLSACTITCQFVDFTQIDSVQIGPVNFNAINCFVYRIECHRALRMILLVNLVKVLLVVLAGSTLVSGTFIPAGQVEVCTQVNDTLT